MLNMDEIHEEIKKLENCNCTSWDVCKKLAILYIIREHYNNSPIQKDTGLNMSMSSPMSIK